MLQPVVRRVVYTIFLLAISQQIAASDSEVVEALASSNSSEASHLPETVSPNWSPNDSVHVKPYNILEASCPPGYVLANKHCHKRVRGAPTME